MRGSKISRRQLLAGVAGAGATGALVGTGTAALFTDEEGFSARLTAGLFDLVVEHAGGTSTGTVPLVIDAATGSEQLTAQLPGERNNPGYAWLRTVCPEEDLPAFADDIAVTLSYVDCGGDGDTIATGSLAEVAEQLRGGEPLDPRCLGPAEVDPGGQACLSSGGEIDLLLEWDWDLQEDYDGGPQDLVALEFAGLQCRNADGTRNPFPDVATTANCETDDPPTTTERYAVSFCEVYADDGDGCKPVGKLELEDGGYCGQSGISENQIAEGTYDLYTDGDDCEKTGYDMRVTDTETKDGGSETVGLAFELLGPDGSDPTLCEVRIKGSGTVEYDSGFDGNATGGLLYAPEKDGGGSGGQQ
jgi:predicted ribosomally synthesized peptide with SipW-like signal peptide